MHVRRHVLQAVLQATMAMMAASASPSASSGVRPLGPALLSELPGLPWARCLAETFDLQVGLCVSRVHMLCACAFYMCFVYVLCACALCVCLVHVLCMCLSQGPNLLLHLLLLLLLLR